VWDGLWELMDTLNLPMTDEVHEEFENYFVYNDEIGLNEDSPEVINEVVFDKTEFETFEAFMQKIDDVEAELLKMDKEAWENTEEMAKRLQEQYGKGE
jgi:hypothetical protein